MALPGDVATAQHCNMVLTPPVYLRCEVWLLYTPSFGSIIIGSFHVESWYVSASGSNVSHLTSSVQTPDSSNTCDIISYHLANILSPAYCVAYELLVSETVVLATRQRRYTLAATTIHSRLGICNITFRALQHCQILEQATGRPMSQSRRKQRRYLVALEDTFVSSLVGTATHKGGALIKAGRLYILSKRTKSRLFLSMFHWLWNYQEAAPMGMKKPRPKQLLAWKI